MVDHTPGPWTVEDGSLVKGVEDGPTGYFVCHPKTKCDATALAWFEHKADAIICAAAPDLLAALQEAVAQYGKPGGPWNVPSDPGGWLDRARAAIAKATGQ